MLCYNFLNKKTTFVCALLVALTGCCGKKNVTAVSDLTSSIKDVNYLHQLEKVGNKVYFSYNKSTLSKEARSTLNTQSDWIKDHQDVLLTIEGHCDERGTREYNLSLGEKRAEAVKEYLIGLGIDSSKLDTISYGKERPNVVGTGEKVWKLNRRAVTVPR